MQKFFININRSGGTIFSRSLGINQQHVTAKEFIAEFGRDEWDEGFKFAFVRNPWDRALSFHRFRMNATRQEGNTTHVEFKEWVRLAFVEKAPEHHDNPRVFMPQVEWLKNDEEIINLNHIARFEDIRQEYGKLAGLFGFDKDLPPLKASDREDYRDFYDIETAEIIENWYQPDIDFFGYKFD